MPKRKQPKTGSKPKRNLVDEIREIIQDAITHEDPLIEVLEDISCLGSGYARSLAQVAANDPDKMLRDYGTSLLMLGIKEAGVPEGVQRRLAEESRPVLLEALKNKDMPDEQKILLGTLYQMGGGEMPDAEYRGYFRDFDATMRMTLEKLQAQLSDQPNDVEQWLMNMELLNHEGEPVAEGQVEFGMRASSMLAQKSPEAAAAICCTIAAIAIETRVPARQIVPGLDMLAESRHEKAAWWLGELGRMPAGGEIAQHAAGLAEQMKGAGVAPRMTLLRDFSHAYVSMVDGVGSRSLNLFFRTGEGGMDGLVFMLNDIVGMKDAWGAFEDSSELQDAIGQRYSDLSYAPVTLDLAREVLGDMYALHEQNEKPFPGRFLIFRPYFGDGPIEPKRRTPNLGAYMLEMMLPTAVLVQDSEEMADYGPYGGLRFASDESYAFVKANLPKRGRKLPKKAFDQFLRDVAPLEREALLRRVAMNLEMEALAGRATQRVNQIAARTYLAMRDNVVPFHEVPYVRALGEEAVEAVIANLRHGYASQQQANQAGMDFDSMMQQLIERLGSEGGFPQR